MMRTYQTVYRFRFVPELGAWEKILLFPAIVSGTTKRYELSEGLDRAARVVIRIVSPEEMDVMSGDVIAFCDGDAPETENSVTVLSVTDNRYGTRNISHTKLICA